MRGSRGATGAVAPSAKPRSRARRLCALACALAVLVTVSLGSDRSANPRAPSDRGDASSSRAPNLDAVTGGGTGVSPALGEKPAVAVYFTGQARTLRRTLCSVRRHIFDPLMEQGFAPVVFVAGERDADAEEYASLLGRIPGVELGDVLIVDRPEASPRSEETVKYEDLPEPDDDAALPAVPRACVDACVRTCKRACVRVTTTDQTNQKEPLLILDRYTSTTLLLDTPNTDTPNARYYYYTLLLDTPNTDTLLLDTPNTDRLYSMIPHTSSTPFND